MGLSKFSSSHLLGALTALSGLVVLLGFSAPGIVVGSRKTAKRTRPGAAVLGSPKNTTTASSVVSASSVVTTFSSSARAGGSFYDLQDTDVDGKVFHFGKLKGQVVYATNTACL